MPAPTTTHRWLPLQRSKPPTNTNAAVQRSPRFFLETIPTRVLAIPLFCSDVALMLGDLPDFFSLKTQPLLRIVCCRRPPVSTIFSFRPCPAATRCNPLQPAAIRCNPQSCKTCGARHRVYGARASGRHGRSSGIRHSNSAVV